MCEFFCFEVFLRSLVVLWGFMVGKIFKNKEEKEKREEGKGRVEGGEEGCNGCGREVYVWISLGMSVVFRELFFMIGLLKMFIVRFMSCLL